MALSAGRRTAAQRSGDAAEAAVSAHLVAAGWRVFGQQVRIGRAELDIVGLDPGPPAALVLVEVRWRGSRDFGLAEETVDARKLGRLREGLTRLLAAGALPGGHPLPRLPARIDLVVTEPPVAPGSSPRFRHYRAIG